MVARLDLIRLCLCSAPCRTLHKPSASRRLKVEGFAITSAICTLIIVFESDLGHLSGSLEGLSEACASASRARGLGGPWATR